MDMKVLTNWYNLFEKWFNENLGWFFINGNKIDQLEEFEIKD
tara:strand:+ start:9716 stop:9841 length:126 start_codon:yes stop_codon:yes gene_type:complete